MDNQKIVEYLNNSSSENKSSDEFIAFLDSFIKEWTEGSINVNTQSSGELTEQIDKLLEKAEQVNVYFMPYSEITRIVFKYQTDGLDMFEQKLRDRIKTDLKDLGEGEEINNKYLVMLKCLEHLKLAITQYNNLYAAQERKLKKADKDLKKADKDLKDVKANINNIAGQAESLNSDYKNLVNKNEKMTVDFVTILGIFTSITFATFGGLQLLGNVFGNIKSVDSASVGSELMLGSVFLFGTYMILIALLTGLSRLMGREYRTSFPTRFLMVSSFCVIFVFGLIYSNVDLIDIFAKHPVICPIAVIAVTAILICAAWFWDRHYEKKHVKATSKLDEK